MTHEHHWQRLSQLLQDECRAYGNLLALLKEEWSVLRKLHYQRLVHIADQKETLLASITNLENDRVTCGKVLNGNREQDASLKWLVQSTLPHALPAKRALKELMSIGAEVKQLSDRNSGLLNRGIHVVREAMKVVQEGLGLQPVYGKSGQMSTPSVPTSLNVEG